MTVFHLKFQSKVILILRKFPSIFLFFRQHVNKIPFTLHSKNTQLHEMTNFI